MGISIVILTFNKFEYTKRCIESVREHTKDEEYEIIIVDNNSSDNTRKWLSGEKDLKVILNKENVGFPSGCNIGIKESKKENDILLLNNDVIVTNNWLSNLKKSLYSNEEIGAVGPLTNSCPYYQNIDVSYNNLDEMKQFAEKFNISNKELWEERQKLIGFCMLIKREALEKIGFLDEKFSPGNYEDDDLSIRLIDNGYKLYLCKDTFIHHYGSMSFSEKSEYKTILKRNEDYFKTKWGFTSGDNMSIYRRYEQFIDGNNPKILEVFCGTGATAMYLMQKKQCVYYGYDDNSEALYYYRGHMKCLNYIDKIKEIEFKFDYLIISNVKELLKSEQLCIALKDIIAAETRIIVNLDDEENNEETINSILRCFGDERLTLSDGLNEKSDISKALNRVYLVFANKSYEEIIKLLKEDINYKEKILDIIIKDNNLTYSLIKAIKLYSRDALSDLNDFAKLLYKKDIIECGEVFRAAYDYNNKDYNTLLNIIQFFYEIGQYQVALIYINTIEDKDNKILELHNKIIKKKRYEEEIKFIIRRIEFGISKEDAVNKLKEKISNDSLSEELLIKVVNESIINKLYIYNLLGIICFEINKYEFVIPLLIEGYKIDNNDLDTNYNLAYILNTFGERELALDYLLKIPKKSKEIEMLISEIKGEKYE